MEEAIRTMPEEVGEVTYDESLNDIFLMALERFEALFELMSEADNRISWSLGLALVRDAKRLSDEACEFINNKFGEIRIVRSCHNQPRVKDDEMLGVIFEKANGDQKAEEVCHD